jgi:hypothetical protein
VRDGEDEDEAEGEDAGHAALRAIFAMWAREHPVAACIADHGTLAASIAAIPLLRSTSSLRPL